MANKQHLHLIRQGIGSWNKWRRDNPAETPDLSDVNLCLTDLSRMNFSRANLWEANLSKARCRGSDFREANLCFADMGGSDLSGADLSRADLTDADLSGANLRNADLSNAKAWGANLRRTDLSGANLGGTDLCEADLRHSELTRASFRGTILTDAKMAEAKLSHTDFSHAELSGADFTMALVEWCIFANVDLSTAGALDTVRHYAPSSICVDSICRSGGNIPESFLRGTGMPDNFIANMALLAGQSVSVYSCFISHGAEDRLFAEHLHTDLQKMGFRCWLSEYDMEGHGEHGNSHPMFHVSYSALLLVLSEHSVGTGWVKEKIADIAENTRTRKNVMLFPVCLDAAPTHAEYPGGATIRHSRRISDFSGWKSPEVYQKVISQLSDDIRNSFPSQTPGAEIPQVSVPQISALVNRVGDLDFPEAAYRITEESDCPLFYKMGDELRLSGKSVLFPYGKPACLILIEDITRVHTKYEKMNGGTKAGYVFRCSGCAGSVRLKYQEMLLPFAKQSSDDTDAIIKLLGTFSMFKDLRADDLGHIVSVLKFRKFPMDHVIIKKGEVGKNLYIVLSGKIEVVGEDNISIAVMGKGDVFGEMSLLSGNPVGATIKVLEPVMILYMTGRDFNKMLNKFPSLQMYFTQLLARRLAEVHDIRSEEFASGMVGKLSEMPPSELFQTLNINQKTGILTLALPKENGLLAFREGELVRAEYAGLEGREAFYEMLGQKEGRFKFIPELPPDDMDADAIQDFMWLLMEGVRKIDEKEEREINETDETAETAETAETVEMDGS